MLLNQTNPLKNLWRKSKKAENLEIENQNCNEMLYLLDTSTCVFFLRGRLNLDKIFLDRGVENCYISELTVFELKYGAENSGNPKKSHEAVNRFVGGLKVMPILGIADK